MKLFYLHPHVGVPGIDFYICRIAANILNKHRRQPRIGSDSEKAKDIHEFSPELRKIS
jgi:hypothetical protein